MKKIGVLGAGTMGAGIAQVLLQGGYEVAMRARRESSIEERVSRAFRIPPSIRF